jgi:ferredoxin
MKTTIYYFSGTGNSLKIAKDLSERIEECKLEPITKYIQKKEIIATSEKVGFIFPLHYWGLPRIVYDFVEKVKLDKTTYLFAVITRSGGVNGIPLIQIERILKTKSKALSSGFFIRMPNNYILDDEVTPEEEQKEWFEEANRQIRVITEVIEESKKTLEVDITKTKRGIEKINKSFRDNVYENDKFFYADKNCNNCGICEIVCPVNNIILVEDKPQWQHKCLQCLACINYCPEKSIQFGQKTLGKDRYHHPEVAVKDIINQKQP